MISGARLGHFLSKRCDFPSKKGRFQRETRGFHDLIAT